MIASASACGNTHSQVNAIVAKMKCKKKEPSCRRWIAEFKPVAEYFQWKVPSPPTHSAWIFSSIFDISVPLQIKLSIFFSFVPSRVCVCVFVYVEWGASSIPCYSISSCIVRCQIILTLSNMKIYNIFLIDAINSYTIDNSVFVCALCCLCVCT